MAIEDFYYKTQEQETESGETLPKYVRSLSQEEAGIYNFLDTKAIIKKIYHLLRGDEYDYENDCYIKTNKPLLNRELLLELLNELETYISEGHKGNLDDEDIRKITISFAERLSSYLALNAKRLNIDPLKQRQIVHRFSDLVFLMLKRSELGFELKTIKTMIQVLEQSLSSQEEQKTKLRPKFFKIF